MAKYKIKDGVGIIPEGTTVIEIEAFSDCTGLTSIVIPDSVTKIEEDAFKGCTGLTSIVIPGSVTGIGKDAFMGCTGLTSIVIPDSVTEIRSNAFNGCTGLTSIVIPDSVVVIGYDAFSGCTGLTSIVIPDSVTEIRSNAFNGCTGLTSIVVSEGNRKYDSRNNCNAIIETESNTLISGCMNTVIPDSVTEIGDGAFKGCTGLTSIVIPDSVTEIGWNAFQDCTGLTSIVIPDSVTEIGMRAFQGCTGLTSIVIPDSVTKIGQSAFFGCTGLTSIVIGNSVTEIEMQVFQYCTGLTSIVIPDSVTEIGDYAFSGCTGLTSIVIPDSVTKIGRSAFSGCTGLTSIVIPDSVTEIGEDAFYGCTGLTSIVIPDSVKEIGYEAFYGCTGLTSIVIPDSVTGIGNSAFSGCTGLTSIVIPDLVTEIGDYAFSGCTGLTSITIGSSIMIIGESVFLRCFNLKQIVMRVANPSQIEIGRGVELRGHQATLYVPDKKSVSAYKKKAVWKKFASIGIMAMNDDSFLNAEKQKEAQNKVFLERLGIKEAIALSPIPLGVKEEDILTIVYNIDEAELPFSSEIELKEDRDFYMLVDDMPKQKYKIEKKVTFMQAGYHIIRIFPFRNLDLDGFGDYRFPGSELIKLPDAMEDFDRYGHSGLYGAKKLLLGSNYNYGISRFYKFDEIAVVPENPYMEMQDGCIVSKKSRELIYMPAKITEIPNGVKGIQDGALYNYSSPVLKIPGSIKDFSLGINNIKNPNLKEIILDEGVQRASFSSHIGRNFLKTVHLPASLEIIDMFDVEVETMVIPVSVRKASFCGCNIKHLEIQGNIIPLELAHQIIHYDFKGFLGEIFLMGSIKSIANLENLENLEALEDPEDLEALKDLEELENLANLEDLEELENLANLEDLESLEDLEGIPGIPKYLGKMSDGCIIHVKDESVAQTIRECADFNPNVKIIVE